ncbi:MAG TPA: TCP-1/cpn60 chaperonin family protein [Candidatus Dormibacteraeota bacterium]|nr:TCP-1/cpn60 chaperonin family protein [Candidatus Dormibacteraeota bacterium]
MLASRQESSASYPVFNKARNRLNGREAWTNNLELAELAASKIASCLGPTGSYKLVAYRRGPELVTKVTKDAVDMVDELGVQYPAIKTLAEAAKIQRDEAGDGVSTLLVLVSSLLEQAQRLVEQGIHRVAILDGYKESAKKAIEMIDELAFQYRGDLENDLLQIVDCGRGLLNAKLRKELIEAIDLVEDQNGLDLSRIAIEKKLGGSMEESRLVRGIVIKKEKRHRSMPEIVEAPKIAIVYRKLELKRDEQLAIGEGPFPTLLNVTKAGQLTEYKAKERALRVAMVDKVKATGANVLFVGHKIDERVADRLSRDGIFALEMIGKRALDEVSRATGAKIAGSVDLLSKEDLGSATLLEVDKIRPDQVTILQCEGAATLLLRGGSPELVQELEKVVRRALLVLKHSRARSKVVPGGGALFMELALRLRSFALSFPGRQQLAVRAFGDAMETVPRWLAFNMGLDPIDTMMQLRSQHANNLTRVGVSEQGCLDMSDLNVVELASIVKTTIWRTLEVAALLLKIDDYFYVKDRPIFHKQ